MVNEVAHPTKRRQVSQHVLIDRVFGVVAVNERPKATIAQVHRVAEVTEQIPKSKGDVGSEPGASIAWMRLMSVTRLPIYC
jgi:hypothetical protein